MEAVEIKERISSAKEQVRHLGEEEGTARAATNDATSQLTKRKEEVRMAVAYLEKANATKKEEETCIAALAGQRGDLDVAIERKEEKVREADERLKAAAASFDSLREEETRFALRRAENQATAETAAEAAAEAAGVVASLVEAKEEAKEEALRMRETEGQLRMDLQKMEEALGRAKEEAAATSTAAALAASTAAAAESIAVGAAVAEAAEAAEVSVLDTVQKAVYDAVRERKSVLQYSVYL